MGGRYVDIGIAVCLAVAPLLPTGPRYAGFPPFTYVDLVILPLALVWVANRVRAKGGVVRPLALPVWAWHLTIAAILGAAVFGLMFENRLDSRVFLARLLYDAGDLLRPMNHAAHPLYPLRVALTFVEGWLAFLLVSDLVRRAPDSRRRAAAALAGWFVGFSLVSAFAILQYATRFQLHHYWLKANPNIVRAHSTLDDPNALGAYLVLGIGLLVGLLRLGDARRRLLWIVLLALGTAALATTMSRAALGAVVLGPLGVLALLPHPVTPWQRAVRTTGRLVTSAVLIVALASVVSRMFITDGTRTQPESGAELVVKTFDPRESADWVLRGRLPWWGAAIGMFRDHPLSGVGLGRYPRVMGEYGGGRSRENTHNLYLQMFAETGVFGGVAFLVLCVSVCMAFARKLREAEGSQVGAMALGGLIASISFLMTLLTGHTLMVPSGQILWASFIAAVAGLATWEQRSEGDRAAPERRSVARQWLVRAAAFALVLWYPAAATIQDVAPRTGSWGYEWGLFQAEHAGSGVSYRWTSGRALLDLEVPAGTVGIELPVAAPSPIRGGKSVRVRATTGGRVSELVLSTSDVQTLHIPLGSPALTESGRASITIDVDPTFTPSRLDPASQDHRVLGVQLLRPLFVIGGSSNPPE